MFCFFTDATPVRVWHALTQPGHTRTYLEGMALRSDWVVGSAIVASFRGELTQLGEVLCVQAHTRLSYVIRPPAASAVYLTWLIRRRVDGCICSLQIDEADNLRTGAVPELHVVRGGDTLWDICFLYFNDPFQWPKIWSYNPQITNPHWIYPGDLVRRRPRNDCRRTLVAEWADQDRLPPGSAEQLPVRARRLRTARLRTHDHGSARRAHGQHTRRARRSSGE